MRDLLARAGSASLPGVTVPSVGVCSAYPVLGAPLAAVGLGSVVIALHMALWFLAPLNLVLMWVHFRRHRDPRGMLASGLGIVFIMIALSAHFLHAIPHDLIWVGLALLGAGALVDWRAQGRQRFLLRAGPSITLSPR